MYTNNIAFLIFSIDVIVLNTFIIRNDPLSQKPLPVPIRQRSRTIFPYPPATAFMTQRVGYLRHHAGVLHAHSGTGLCPSRSDRRLRGKLTAARFRTACGSRSSASAPPPAPAGTFRTATGPLPTGKAEPLRPSCRIRHTEKQDAPIPEKEGHQKRPMHRFSQRLLATGTSVRQFSKSFKQTANSPFRLQLSLPHQSTSSSTV